ncbi:MAG: transcriptional regulator, TetR family, partial [Porphyrobacter sp. HL-46]
GLGVVTIGIGQQSTHGAVGESIRLEAVGEQRLQLAAEREQDARLLRLEEETLGAHLPEHVRADVAASRGLGVILSFNTWRLLRHDQGLPVADAKAVVLRLLGDAIARWPDP